MPKRRGRSRLAGPHRRAGPEIVLKSSEFRKGREAGWRELEGLVDRVERRGVRALSLDELQRLPILYRAALSSLSVARTIALDRNLLLYLENLALRAFLAVYGPRVQPARRARRLLRPRAAGGGALGALAYPDRGARARWSAPWRASCSPCRTKPGSPRWCRPGSPAAAGPSSTRADLLSKEIFAPWPGAAESFGIFANVLFSHNTLVGILTFGLGMAAGIPTLLLSVYQGLPLGAFIALHYNRDLTVDFLGWLAIHGVTELGALMLFAAGGLVIAEKILFPGRYSRHRESRLARPAGGADGGRRGAHAVRGGDPRRRLSPAGAEHAAALRHRVRRRRALARLFLLRRQGKARRAKGAATMTLIHERTSEFFEGGRRERRQIITPEGVPVHGRARRSRRAADRLRASTCSSGSC